MSNSYVSIFVKNMRVNVRIGLLDSEKLAPQPLHISAELFAAPDYLLDDDIIDYSVLYNEIESWESRSHTDLLETLLNHLFESAFGFDAVMAAKIQIEKPNIFEKTQQAGISAYLTRDDYWALRKK